MLIRNNYRISTDKNEINTVPDHETYPNYVVILFVLVRSLFRLAFRAYSVPTSKIVGLNIRLIHCCFLETIDVAMCLFPYVK